MRNILDWDKLTEEDKEELRKKREEAWSNGQSALKKLEKGVKQIELEPEMFKKLRKILRKGE